MRALVARWPGLGHVPRVDLGVRETPLERWRVDGASLLVKRDDLSAEALGGNKVRALELLLAGATPGRPLLTVGATGSTHALAVAAHGARLGMRTEVITWPQEEHAVSRATALAMRTAARVTPAASVAGAYLRAALRRLRGRVHWVPAGGSVPLGALGHVSAALELAEQLGAGVGPGSDRGWTGVGPGSDRGRTGVEPRKSLRDNEPFSSLTAGHPRTDPGPSPAPRRHVLVVPLGSGGTVAGLLVGLSLAGLRIPVIAVQVVPRVVASRRRVARLARRTYALVARHAGSPLPALRLDGFTIERGAYGGAYGRPTAEAREAAARLAAAGGPVLDLTYSAKAFAVALARARSRPEETVVFWLTFDGRWLP